MELIHEEVDRELFDHDALFNGGTLGLCVYPLHFLLRIGPSCIDVTPRPLLIIMNMFLGTETFPSLAAAVKKAPA